MIIKIIACHFILVLCGCTALNPNNTSNVEDELVENLSKLFHEENTIASKVDVSRITTYDWHYESMKRDAMREESAVKIGVLLDQLYKQSNSCSDYRMRLQKIVRNSGVSLGLMLALSNQGKCGPFDFVRRINEDLNFDYQYSQQVIQLRVMNQ